MEHYNPRIKARMIQRVAEEVEYLKLRLENQKNALATMTRNARKYTHPGDIAMSDAAKEQAQKDLEGLQEQVAKAIRAQQQSPAENTREQLLEEAQLGGLVVIRWTDKNGEFTTESTGNYVYFIQAGVRGPIKIGRSRDPLRRLESLQIGNAELLQLRKVYLDAGCEVEAVFHEMFAEARIRGEWFSPTDELMQIVRTAYY